MCFMPINRTDLIVQINFRGKRMDNPECTMQRHRQHWTQGTELKQAKLKTALNTES